MRILIVLLLAMSCGPKKPACEPTADVEAKWASESMQLVDSGVCDKYARVEDCPDFRELQLVQQLRDSSCSN